VTGSVEFKQTTWITFGVQGSHPSVCFNFRRFGLYQTVRYIMLHFGYIPIVCFY